MGTNKPRWKLGRHVKSLAHSTVGAEKRSSEAVNGSRREVNTTLTPILVALDRKKYSLRKDRVGNSTELF